MLRNPSAEPTFTLSKFQEKLSVLIQIDSSFLDNLFFLSSKSKELSSFKENHFEYLFCLILIITSKVCCFLDNQVYIVLAATDCRCD